MSVPISSTAVRAGTPVWTDLTVSDVESVQPFYEQLFGWSFQDAGEDAGHYRMIEKDGVVVGGAVSAGDRRAGWTVYLVTDDIEHTLTLVESAAGKVLAQAMPVGDLGVMALTVSPAGDNVGWWQSGAFEGLDRSASGPGVPRWFELMSTNYDTHLSFYRDVIGWEPSPLTGEHLSARYTTNFPGDQASAGMLEAQTYLPVGTISYWRVYFGVEDLEAAVQQAEDLGGDVLAGPVDSPHGRMAVIRDPQGAGFPIVQLPRG